MRKVKLFKSTNKTELLEKIYYDYIYKDMTISEISDKYGYTIRQVRYILDRYLLVKKGKGKRKHMENIEKSDDELVMVDGKLVKKATVEDLMAKAEICLEDIALKKKSTNKKVENK